jgi:hypothetical protein
VLELQYDRQAAMSNYRNRNSIAGLMETFFFLNPNLPLPSIDGTHSSLPAGLHIRVRALLS